MALEDLTGPSKFLNALVIGNPVSDDDRREGDDHIRGLKNVLRNQFPNLDGAVTLTDEQMNALANLNTLALLKANNLSDLASAITARVNLGLQDAAGHLTPAAPTTTALPALSLLPMALEQGLRIDSADESGAMAGAAMVTRSVSASLAVQFFIAHSFQNVQMGNARGGTLELWTNGAARGVIDANGDLAIGGAKSGVARITMWGADDARLALLSVNTGASSGPNILFYRGAANLIGSFGALANRFGGGGNDMLLDTPLGDLVWTTNGLNERMRLTQAGVFSLSSAPAANDNTGRVPTTAWVQANSIGGLGSTWRDMTGTGGRAVNGAALQNTTGKPMALHIYGTVNGNGAAWQIQVGVSSGGAFLIIGFYQSTVSGSALASAQAIVPAGYWYKLVASGATPAVNAWLELW